MATLPDPTPTLHAGLDGLEQVIASTRSAVMPELAAFAEAVLATIQRGGKLLFCGNGGSAADAQHMATEYVIRYRRNRKALPAIALTTDTSLITAAANDLGYETIFARQVEALARPEDLLILHSTSGESANLLAAVVAADAVGCRTAALLAKGGGALRSKVGIAVVIPTQSTSHAQEMHLMIEHLVCQYVEESLGLA